MKINITDAQIESFIDVVFYEINYGINQFEAANHYSNIGWKLNYNPHPLFDSKFYVESNLDVRRESIDPFKHFIRFGLVEKRSPNPLVDIEYFYSQKDEETAAIELISYFSKTIKPDQFTINPHPLFDLSYYYAHCKNKPITAPPFLSFLEEKGACATPCHELFNPAWYCENSIKWRTQGVGNPLYFYIKNKDFSSSTSRLFDNESYFIHHLKNDKISPVLHYITIGHSKDFNPNPLFNEKWYRNKYQASGNTPQLLNYLRYGFKLKNNPSLFINEGFVSNQVIGSNKSALEIQIEDEANEAIVNPNPYFNKNWYKLNYGTKTPLYHFIENIEHHKRNINYNFFAELYLTKNVYDLNKLEKIFHKDFISHANKFKKIHKPEIISKILSPENDSESIYLDLPLTNTEEFTRNKKNNSPIANNKLIYDVFLCSGTRLIWPLNKKCIIHDEYAKYKNKKLLSKSSNINLSFDGKKISTKVGAPVFYLEKAFHLMHEYDRNYYHFIFELLPKAINYGINKLTENIIISDDLHPNIMELLSKATRKPEKFVKVPRGEWIYCNQVLYGDDINYCFDVYARQPKNNDIFYDPKNIQKLLNFFSDNYSGNSRIDSKRIYFERNSGSRLPLNQYEIKEKIKEEFHLLSVDPSKLSIEEQISIFSSVDLIVSPTGACLSNLIFCKPNTCVVILYPDSCKSNILIWEKIAQKNNLNIVHQFCPSNGLYELKYEMHNDYIINFELLKSNIKMVLEKC